MAITAGVSYNQVPALTSDIASKLSRPQRLSGLGTTILPDLMEKEAEVFGNEQFRFLSQVGAEEAMTADQVIWSEQGRLHLSYKGTY